MHSFHCQNGELYCEQTPLRELVEKHGTPLYVYSRQTIAGHFGRLQSALSPLAHRICYAVKANSNLAVLRLLARMGSSFDTVSEGELRRVLAAGGQARDCVFAGVGKSEREIGFALRKGIYCFNVESEAELERIAAVAGRLKKIAPISVRINPDVDAHTHAKITTGTYENKFGVALERVGELYARAARLKSLRPLGVQMHIGSQLTDSQPFVDAVKKVAPLVRCLAERHHLEFFSLGGGLGIVYDPALASGDLAWWRKPIAGRILTPESFGEHLIPLLRPLGLRIVIEPGRFIVGNAGVLLTRVEYVKQTDRKRFIIVDAAMNDLIRPAMYESYHEIVPLRRTGGAAVASDVVGPICESSDWFAKNRPLPPVKQGDLLAVLSAGAYGFAMASNYNSRAFAAEVMVDGRRSALVRRRQRLEEIWADEKIPAWA